MALRVRSFIAVLAILIPVLFFTIRNRYDNLAISRLTQSLDRVSFGNVSYPSYASAAYSSQSHLSSSISSQTLDQFCGQDAFLPPPLTFDGWLKHKNFTRAYMRPNFAPPDTRFPPLETINRQVLQGFKSLDRGTKISDRGNENRPFKCPPVVDVGVAEDHGVDNTEGILFGLATTVDRLNQLLPSLLFSYAHTKAHVLVLVPHDTQHLHLHQQSLRRRGLNVTLMPSPLPFLGRYFGLVEAFREFIQNERPNTTWVSWVDDDTFFPSLANIGNRLAELDHTQKHYIGALSEASWQVVTFGNIGFGGAGVFVSRPLLEELHKNYQTCQDWGEQPGDQKLAQCIKKYGDTQLTLWPTLYQMDMHGAPDGVFESGRQLDSLHHWKTWYQKDVVKMSTVAAAAGRSSVLRRWRFDERVTVGGKRIFWVLTNGYSMVRYKIDAKLPADSVRFDHTEKTWSEDPRGYEARLGPLRPVDQPGVEKERWMLAESFVVGNNVHQLYTREEWEGSSAIELVWLGSLDAGAAAE